MSSAFDFGTDLITIKQYEVLSELPDLLTMDDGSRVKTAEDWQKRRSEIYKTAVELQYGVIPPAPESVKVETVYKSNRNRSQHRIISDIGGKRVVFTLYIFYPDAPNPPITVDGDLCFGYAFDEEFIKAFTDNGIALALFNRCELAHDSDDERDRSGQLYEACPGGDFGAIAAWAWGYSRVVDALEQLGGFDLDLISFTGHSRGGKTAMLAGVLDERAAIVCPNETNCGSCGCYRTHTVALNEDGNEGRSERLSDMVKNFPEWLGPHMKDYADDEGSLPFDCHFLKSLVAPRTLIVAEAGSDLWTNPVGSWQTSLAAKEVWKLLGCEENMLWYFRRGYHYHTVDDVKMLVSVIKSKRDKTPLDTKNFFKLPFDTESLSI